MPDDNVTDQNNGGTNPPSPGNLNELPQWARDAISKANNEAASFRVQLRDKTNEHTAALEQITALTGEKDLSTAAKSAAETALLKMTVALSAGVPGDKAADFAALLQGDTEDALKTHAETVKGLFGSQAPPRATDPSQGRGEEDDSAASTPESAFAAVLKAQLDGLKN